MRMISVDDVRLEVSEAGQGSAVLLLHGIPTSWFNGFPRRGRRPASPKIGFESCSRLTKARRVGYG